MGYTDLVGDELDDMYNDGTSGDDEHVVSGDSIDIASGDVSLVGAAMAKRGASTQQIALKLGNLFRQKLAQASAGASRASLAPQRRHAQGIRPQVKVPGTEVRDLPYNDRRRFAMAMTSGIAVPAGATIVVRQQPPQPYRPERLVIGSDIGSSFVLTNFQIGKKLQFMTPDPISGVIFAENAVGNEMQCDTIQTSQLVILSVTNTSVSDIVFLATLWGITVQLQFTELDWNREGERKPWQPKTECAARSFFLRDGPGKIQKSVRPSFAPSPTRSLPSTKPSYEKTHPFPPSIKPVSCTPASPREKSGGRIASGPGQMVVATVSVFPPGA